MKKAVAYLRVSTNKQGVLGLGIEAQRAAVASFCQQRGYEVSKEFVEAESGRKSVRVELEKARSYARLTKATLVVAKLDRLSRDVDMIRSFIKGGEPVRFCDLPDIPEGPVGKFMLTAMAMVAEFEVGLISQRTKNAMAAAKARGQKFGNVEALERYRASLTKPHDNSAALEVQSEQARVRVADVTPHIKRLQNEGITSLGGIARTLNTMGIAAAKGGRWHKNSVRRVLYAMPE